MSGNSTFKPARGNAWMERTVDLALAVAAKRGERSLKSTDAGAWEESVASQPTVSAGMSQSSTFWHPHPLCRTDFYCNGILSQRVDWKNDMDVHGVYTYYVRDTDFLFFFFNFYFFFISPTFRLRPFSGSASYLSLLSSCVTFSARGIFSSSVCISLSVKRTGPPPPQYITAHYSAATYI